MDMTPEGSRRQARVSVGESSFASEEEAAEDDADGFGKGAGAGYAAEADATPSHGVIGGGSLKGLGTGSLASPKMRKKSRANYRTKEKAAAPFRASYDRAPSAEQHQAALRRSTLARSKAKRVRGLTRIDLQHAVNLPDGSSTMVALFTKDVKAEETFLYTPGGAGQGYAHNPYRVVRFRNTTDYVLEPGPISIYSGDTFVGEGISETVSAGASVTIPFSAEPSLTVTSHKEESRDEMKLLRLSGGVLEVERFHQVTTTWRVRSTTKRKEARKVLVRHTRRGERYALTKKPKATEELVGAYLIPVTLAPNTTQAEEVVREQTPARMQLEIWDSRATELLETLLKTGDLNRKQREALTPVVELRRKLGRLDTKIDGLKRQQVELNARADQTRANLKSIEKDKRAAALRARLRQKLESFSNEADALGRQIVELNSERLSTRIELEEALEKVEFERAEGKPRSK